jgi:hypothetical protein
MSFCITADCPHGERSFIRLDAGPYRWVHAGGMAPCELLGTATAEEAGEVCACSHEGRRHEAGSGPLPHGLIAKPRACLDCGCRDFRHRPEDVERWRASETGRRGGNPVPVAVPAAETGPAEGGQLELFPAAGREARPSRRRRNAPRDTATVPVAGGSL